MTTIEIYKDKDGNFCYEDDNEVHTLDTLGDLIGFIIDHELPEHDNSGYLKPDETPTIV